MIAARIAQHALLQELIEFYAADLVMNSEDRDTKVIAGVLARAWVKTHGSPHGEAYQIIMSRARAFLEM